jgi:hypothetical protein
MRTNAYWSSSDAQAASRALRPGPYRAVDLLIDRLRQASSSADIMRLTVHDDSSREHQLVSRG